MTSRRARAKALRADRDLVVGAALRDHAAPIAWVLLLAGVVLATREWYSMWWGAGVAGALAGIIAAPQGWRGRRASPSWRIIALLAVVGAFWRNTIQWQSGFATSGLDWSSPYASPDMPPTGIVASEALMLSCTAALATLLGRRATGRCPHLVGLVCLLIALSYEPAGSVAEPAALVAIVFATAVLLFVVKDETARGWIALGCFAATATAFLVGTGFAFLFGPGANVAWLFFGVAIAAYVWGVLWPRFDPSHPGDAHAASERLAVHAARHPWRASIRPILLVIGTYFVLWDTANYGALIVMLYLAADCHRGASHASLFDRASVIAAPAAVFSVSAVAGWYVSGRAGLTWEWEETGWLLLSAVLPVVGLVVVNRGGAAFGHVNWLRALAGATALAVGWEAAACDSSWAWVASLVLCTALFHLAVVTPVPLRSLRRGALWFGGACMAVAVVCIAAQTVGVSLYLDIPDAGEDTMLFAQEMVNDRWGVVARVAAGAWTFPLLAFGGAILVESARRHRWRTVIPPDHEMFAWGELRANEVDASAS